MKLAVYSPWRSFWRLYDAASERAVLIAEKTRSKSDASNVYDLFCECRDRRRESRL